MYDLYFCISFYKRFLLQIKTCIFELALIRTGSVRYFGVSAVLKAKPGVHKKTKVICVFGFFVFYRQICFTTWMTCMTCSVGSLGPICIL